MAFETVVDAANIPPGKGTRVKLGDKALALFNFNGEFYAIQDFCPHRGASLGFGEIDEDGLVSCPIHAWFFDIKTGECLTTPNGHCLSYDCKIEDGKVMIDPGSERRYTP